MDPLVHITHAEYCTRRAWEQVPEVCLSTNGCGYRLYAPSAVEALNQPALPPSR